MKFNLIISVFISLLPFNINAAPSGAGDTYLLAKMHDEASLEGKKTFYFVGKTYKVQRDLQNGIRIAPLLRRAGKEPFEYTKRFAHAHDEAFTKGECTFQYPSSDFDSDTFEQYPIGHKLLKPQINGEIPRKMNSIEDISENTIKISFSQKTNNHMMELKFGKLDKILRIGNVSKSKMNVMSGKVSVYLDGGSWGKINRYWIDNSGDKNPRVWLTVARADNDGLEYFENTGAEIVYLFDIKNNKGSFTMVAQDWNFNFKILYSHVPKKVESQDKQQINTKCYVE